MRKIHREDILDIASYEKTRAEFRKQIMELKTVRRVAVGPLMTLVFENRDTVLFQIQEMMRVERIVHDDPIQHEIDTYNQLIPDASELSATMFIEVTEYARIREVMDSFVGLPQNCVFLNVDGQRVPAEFDLDQSTETRVSAVQYLRFPVQGRVRAAFEIESTPVSIVVEHPNYRHSTPITGPLRSQLIRDLD